MSFYQRRRLLENLDREHICCRYAVFEGMSPDTVCRIRGLLKRRDRRREREGGYSGRESRDSRS